MCIEASVGTMRLDTSRRDVMGSKIDMHGKSLGCEILYSVSWWLRRHWMYLRGAGRAIGDNRLTMTSIPVGRRGLTTGCAWMRTVSRGIRDGRGLEVFPEELLKCFVIFPGYAQGYVEATAATTFLLHLWTKVIYPFPFWWAHWTDSSTEYGPMGSTITMIHHNMVELNMK